MTPAAPGRLSMMTLSFQSFCNSAAKRRPSTSVPPPGGNGTMMRTRPFGNACARAASIRASRLAIRPASASRRVIMNAHLCNLVCVEVRVFVTVPSNRRSIVDRHEIKPFRRSDRRAGGAVTRYKGLGEVVGAPFPLTNEGQRADHGADLMMQEGAGRCDD